MPSQRSTSIKAAKPTTASAKKTVRMAALALPVTTMETGLSPRTVNQSNELIEAAYSLTLNEKRLLLMAATQIDPRKPPTRNIGIQVTATDFADMYGITSRGHAYEALEDAAVRLYERSIRSIARTKRGIPVEERRWLTGRAVYEDGMVLLEFNEGVLQYMTMFSEQFTSYKLQQVSQLSSFYAIRFYEIAAQCKRVGERYLPLETLRDMLDLGDKYASVKDLRRWVIDPAMQEITSTSDLSVQAEPVREGRKVIGFKLIVGQPQQRSLL